MFNIGQRRNAIFSYLIGDWASAFLAWLLFFLFRKLYIENVVIDNFYLDRKFILGLLIIPTAWTLLYAIAGTYTDIYRKSRMSELANTVLLGLLGVVILFFVLLLDDFVQGYKTYYTSFFILLGLHIVLTAFVRMIILTRASRRIKSGKVGFNTLLIGGNQNALELYKEISSTPKRLGYKFIGFLDINGLSTKEIENHLPKLGYLDDLEKIIVEEKIEEVILAIETSEHNRLKDILTILYRYNILIKIIPDMYDILLGTVKMNHLYGAVLIEIQQGLMPAWQQFIKRMIDISVSICVLIILLPLYAYIALRVRLSSKGSIFYFQERIGLNREPFYIIKFRSMYVDAEKEGPKLASEGDNRITPWGRVMRKWRLDELPQFWNVLKGDMSLVGPRPERQFFIDQIARQAPHYYHLLKVRPGITSWGQVKYGYASSVDEMLQRLKFDILYIENMSLSLDIKIMFYTLLVLLQGRGK